MTRKDIVLANIARILLWLPLPIIRKWGMNINTKIIVKIVVESVTNYKKTLELQDAGEFKDNPLWHSACGLSALLALMPAAYIYGAIKSQEQSVVRNLEVR